MINIIIGGDICPIGEAEEAFSKGDAYEIFQDILPEIVSADLSVVNLECPLVSRDTPIIKAGPILGADTSCINGFAAAKWQVLNLANNHSFDHGANGLWETIRTIEEAGLAYTGAGLNIEEARQPFIKEINNERIIVYSMAEREFSIADEKTPGANPLDLINCVNAIRKYKQNGIFIVLIHGGKEYYPYPSPEMVRRCRFIVDMGADAVICCHTHCPLPWEIYSGRPIVYGLGNLVFARPPFKVPDSWHEGYLACLNIEEKEVGLKVLPYHQFLSKPLTKKMEKGESIRFFEEMEKKGNCVRNKSLLDNLWVAYCLNQKDNYLSGLFGYNRLMRKMRQLLLPLLHSKQEYCQAMHLIQCETHQEILNVIFKNERERWL